MMYDVSADKCVFLLLRCNGEKKTKQCSCQIDTAPENERYLTNDRAKKDSGTKPNPSLERETKHQKQNRGDLCVSHVADCPQPPQKSREPGTNSKSKLPNQDVVQVSNKISDEISDSSSISQ